MTPQEPCAVPIKERADKLRAHYEKVSSAYGEWYNQIPVAIDLWEKAKGQSAQPDAVEALREAADWIDRFVALWDDGVPCFEEVEAETGYLGHAVDISDDVDDAYDLIDRLRALTTDEEGDWRQRFEAARKRNPSIYRAKDARSTTNEEGDDV